MQMTYRVTKWNTPDKDETLVGTPEEARKLIAGLDEKLAGKLPRQARATYLAARATLYEALGDRKMLDAAKDAYAFSKTANTAALVAVALHHYGRLEEANEWYERAFKYPHEAGFEIDIGATNAMLCRGEYTRAWPIIRKLKKRMVFAGYMKEWDGKPCPKLQIIAEGGFGDIIQNSRYLPLLANMGVLKPVLYLPPMFFNSGFLDLAKAQSWWPETRLMTEARQDAPSIGFFDLPAVFNTTPETIPPSPVWVNSTHIDSRYAGVGKATVGFCWAASQSETPLCSRGIYRSLTDEQALQIIDAGKDKFNWVNLQNDKTLPGIDTYDLDSWVTTAAIVKNLDLVITVDTAVMHLAASMGKPVWVLLSGASDWKFGIDGECPWYPNIKLFRNGDFGFNNTVSELTKTISSLCTI